MVINRRRNYLIHKKLQFKYAALTIALLLLYTLLLLSAIFVPPAAIFYSTSLPLSVRAEAADAFILLNNYIWPGIAAIILLFGAISIFVTHKVAGPFFVMTRAMRDIMQGDLKARITLRKRDDLSELAEAVNHMTEKLESTFIDLDKRVAALAVYAQEAAQGQSSPGASRVAAGIEDMKKILEGYKFGDKPRS